MNGHTLADWAVPSVYDKSKLGFPITRMTFDQAIDLVQTTLGSAYRITNAANDRLSFQFMQYIDCIGENGAINEFVTATWICNKIYD
jgi:hypothetical protein